MTKFFYIIFNLCIMNNFIQANEPKKLTKESQQRLLAYVLKQQKNSESLKKFLAKNKDYTAILQKKPDYNANEINNYANNCKYGILCIPDYVIFRLEAAKTAKQKKCIISATIDPEAYGDLNLTYESAQTAKTSQHSLNKWLETK